MARDQSLLSSTTPIAIAPADPYIAHVQLRDLLVCPRLPGLVNYVENRAIIEQDLHARGAPSRVLAELDFLPNSLASLQIGENDTLIAAGGQETELHLSYHTPSTSSDRQTRVVWQADHRLTGSINNSVLLTSLNLTGSNESSVEPRVGISNNDGSVRLYDVPIRVQSPRRKPQEVGTLKLDVPVNHSSISPDGRTLLSVGDSNKVYFHCISGGARLTFTPITTLVIPAPDVIPFGFSTSSLVASFSTAFSRDGSKFAVASQEGVVAVWDVRSTKPLKVFHTDKSRGMGGRERAILGNGAASGWLSDDPWEWTRGTRAPGWCVRNVKFNGGDGARLGREVMAFTEHTSLVHVVDALTFETHDIIRVPTIVRNESRRRHLRQSSAPSIIVSSPGTSTTSSVPSSAAQQRRVRRHLARSMLPVSNTRRTSTATMSTEGSSPPSRRPENPRVARSAIAGQSSSSSSISASSGRPGVVQALNDAFIIPASAYSAPSSIGDSTWRTLNDEMPIRPFSRRSVLSGPDARETSPPPTSPPMPSLQALANYVLEPHGYREAHDHVPEETREDEGALSRRIRREESALRRGGILQFGTGLFEDDEESVSSSEATEYVPSGPGGPGPVGTHRRATSADGIVVVPDLGDRDVETEVHTLLAVHGIPSRFGPRRRRFHEFAERQGNMDLDEGYDDEDGTETDRDTNTGSTHADYDYPIYRRRSRRRRRFSIPAAEDNVFDEAEEDNAVIEEERMDVDEVSHDEVHDDEIIEDDVDIDEEGEEDTDCGSNANSRSASPTLGSETTSIRLEANAQASSSGTMSSSADRESKVEDDDFVFDDAEAGSFYSGSSSSSMPKLAYYDDFDLAGICFDPYGERMYVAGTFTGHGDPALRGNGLFSGAFGNPPRNTGGHLGTVIEWGVRGADKRFWVDEGWM